MKCLAETDIVLDVQSLSAGSPSPKVGEERQETSDPCPTSAQRTPAAVAVLAARVASTIRFSSDREVFGLDLHPSCLAGAVSHGVDLDGLLCSMPVLSWEPKILLTLITWRLEKACLTDVVTVRD